MFETCRKVHLCIYDVVICTLIINNILPFIFFPYFKYLTSVSVSLPRYKIVCILNENFNIKRFFFHILSFRTNTKFAFLQFL